jgi:glycosyltransferase involved in cell wall biosynthesis
VLFLDADERLDPDDAAALRAFVERDAIRGCAYGLQMYRAWGVQVVPRPTYVYRLFFAEPGQRLPTRALHFNPVPAEVARSAWLRTTIRARHLESQERMETRRRKYAEADPKARPGGAAGRTPLAAPDDLVDWGPRPDVAVLAVGAEGERATLPGPADATITCLLPARNAAADVPAYLASAAAVADRVIALDDGSTDATAELLEESPLVERLLRNPVRPGYSGWDDAANRRRLLEAAIEAGGGWVLFLDADERLDPDDAAALRAFVARGADPESAYGFRVFRMVGDGVHFDRAELWVYRLFRAGPGQSLPRERLHLVPVPLEIPRERWRKTTIRIKHLSSLTAERRADRLRKYEQADPDRRWQRDYSGLVAVGPARRRWLPRPQGLPALADPLGRGGGELDLAELDPEGPVLSAIVISRNDAATIERSVRSVAEQRCGAPFEVIVAASGDDGTAQRVRGLFPEVTVLDVPEPGLPGAARNAGVAAARGEFVSFPGSHVELPPGSLAARIRAHELGYSMVTGSIVNGTTTRSGWAAYFLDHSPSLPGRPSGALELTPAHCSYTREALLETGGFPEDMRAGEDTVVNGEIWARGHRAYRAQDVVLTHHNPCGTTWRLVRHHFVRGRALGRILMGGERGRGGRRGLLAYLRSYPNWRLRQIDERVERWGAELHPRYRRARPLVRLGIVAACAGAATEVLLGRSRARPLGGGSRPAGLPDHHH